ncbi:hypothetical protein D3C76_53780 [compost metagenome]
MSNKATEHGDEASMSSSTAKRVSGSKMLTFALLLTVPAVMTGCTTVTSRSDCDPNYENCEEDGGYRSGGGYYRSGGSSSKSGSDHSSISDSSSYKGFGSGGKSSVGG